MYIQPCDNNVNMNGLKDWSKYIKRLKQKALDAVPSATFNNKNVDKWKKFNDVLTRPAENRLIMGATALITQPTIDYYNHKVDKETREVARNRTLAKIIAGTIVGIMVRGSCYKIVENMTKIISKNNIRRALLPTGLELSKLMKHNECLTNYRNALSTGLAILVMSFTNFLIDAPLTAFLTNFFNTKTKEKHLAQKGGSTNATS